MGLCVCLVLFEQLGRVRTGLTWYQKARSVRLECERNGAI